MKINELYTQFFHPDKRKSPYKNEEEHWHDVFCFLDICLNIACAKKYIAPKEEQQILEIANEHLLGMPFSLEDLVDALRLYEVDQQDKIAETDIYNTIIKAFQHIQDRLFLTGEVAEEFPIQIISSDFFLTDFEKFMLVVSLAIYQDSKYEAIFAFLQNDVRMKLPTKRLAIALYRMFADIEKEELADVIENRGEFFEFILEVHNISERAFVRYDQSFLAKKRVYSFCLGYEDIEVPLRDFVHFISWESSEIEEVLIRKEIINATTNIFNHNINESDQMGNVLHVYGQNGLGKHFVIQHAAVNSKKNILFVEVSQFTFLPVSDVEVIMNKIYLETVLLEAIPCFYIDDYYEDKNGEENNQSMIPKTVEVVLRQLKEKFWFSIWMSEEKAEYLKKYEIHFLNIEIAMLSVGERIILWNQYGKEFILSDEIDFNLCANQFVLTIKGIKEVLQTADFIRISNGAKTIMKTDILRGIKQQAANQLGRYATLVNSVFTWEDLVIDEDQRRHMNMICNQLKYRNIVGEEWGFHKKNPYGRGICALFYGSPGTGKTMAVQVIANELGLDLYRIDLSQLVSKYIGETEKNISSLFKRAKNINALLFFDEADSLFAKRTEVKDSKDRNANAETSHLLQKLEDYEGITILATNYVNNIDDAFKRRIKFMVNFVFPTAQVRLDLWRAILPEEAVCEEELDFEFFANKFELSGSNIKEILNNSAYIAAAEGKGLANRHIVEAIKINFAKYGKLLAKDDFEYLG